MGAAGRGSAKRGPLGNQVLFGPKLLNYMTSKSGDLTQVNFLPAAKATVEDPTEIWLAPFRRRDGRVVMRTRYISVYADRQ